ncbi:MAG: response regulator [Syntrophales bacterium]
MIKKKPTLLVVDDAAYNIDVLLAALCRDYTVRVTTDGAAALVSVKRARPALILLDVMMPGLDGFEVCRRLKANPTTREIPIIFLTARNEDADEAYGLELGAVDYITKPFNITVVQARVRNHIELQKHRNNLEELVIQRTTDMQRLTGLLAETEEHQLKMISRELHDQIGQNLNTISLNLTLLKSLIGEPTAEKVKSRLDDSLAIIKETSSRIRNLMAEIRSPVLDDYGLLAALLHFGDQCCHASGLKIVIKGKEITPRPPANIESALYRIAREALTNITKHAQATNVTITLKKARKTVVMTMEDNGIGYDEETLSGHKGWGVITMKERALAVGGNCRVESRRGAGTRVTVEAPL